MDRRNFLLRAATLGAAPLGCHSLAFAAGCPSPRLLPDARGGIERVAMMLAAGEGERVLPTIASLLAALSPRTQAEVLCADRALLRMATAAWKVADPVGARPVRLWLAPGVQSLWARDRFLVRNAGMPRLLRTAEAAGEVDGKVPSFLSACGDEDASGEPPVSEGPWEGGDLLAGEGVVYLGGTTLRRARQRWGDEAEMKLGQFARSELGLKAVLVPSVRGNETSAEPLGGRSSGGNWFDYHLDMLAAVLADENVVLGDVDAADAILARSGERWPELAAQQAESETRHVARSEQRRHLAGLVRAFQAAGVKVHRVPLLVHPERPWMLSYTNVLQEEAEGERVVYLPQYGLARLDAAAADVWRALGYRVRAIDTAPLIPMQGSVRCLTNVLARSV